MADTTSTSNKSSKMAQLMASYSSSFKTFRKGDLVKGKITKLTKNEITVDINAKTEAIVLEKERSILQNLLSSLKVGDEVEVSILNPESDSGNPVVSLRRFIGNLSWGRLEATQKAETQIEVTISEMTKGGAVAITESGQSGFLPNSHISSNDNISVGKKIKVRVLDLNRDENKIVFSQKTTISLKDFEDATKQYKTNTKVEATITNITQFGMFVSLPVEGKEFTLDGLIHISEVAWEKVEDLSSLFASAQKVETIVIGIDKDARRVDLSIKRLVEDPFEKISEQYPVDKRVSAVVTKIDDTGAYLDLGDGVEGVIRKEKIPANVTLKEGQNITATVTDVDRKRHRISLVPVLLEKPIGYR